MAIFNAENLGTAVSETLKGIGEELTVFGGKIGGELCVWWQDANGRTQVSGPKDADVMRRMRRASDFLLDASNAIGVNVNTVSPDVLDRLLSEHHLELARIVADGSSLDVSRAEYKIYVKRFGSLSDREFAEQFPQMATNLTLEQKAWPIRRSYLIRAHMMKAKIEERERRKFTLH
jgi:hypothetical protein